MHDIDTIRTLLHRVEVDSNGLSWSKQRPWRTHTHVFAEGRLPVVDLHDLNAKLSRESVRQVLTVASQLEAGAVRFVVGRGRHSLGPGGTLGKVVRKELKRAVSDNDWYFRSTAATLTLIVDRSRAPASATGALGPGFWLLMASFATAAAYVVGARLGLW